MRFNPIAALAVGLSAYTAAALVRNPQQPYAFAGKTVVITGGSRGLGLVLARQFAQVGANLALVARNPDTLETAADELRAQGAEVMTAPCDVTHKAQVRQAIQAITEHFGQIDVLVNNAGVISVGPLEHMTVEDFEQSIAVHVLGPLYLTFAALPELRRNHGRIVNISSIGGRLAVPHMAAYCAGKFGLAGLSESLYAELARHDVKVTTVLPGMMRTGSPPNATFKGRHRWEYIWFSLAASMPVLSVNAERAAEQIINACRQGTPELVIGLPAKAAILANALFPNLTAHLMSLVNRLLPAPNPAASTQSHTGWESRSRLAPSFLTRLSDQATLKNNETRH